MTAVSTNKLEYPVEMNERNAVMSKKLFVSILILLCISCAVLALQQESMWERDWDAHERLRDERFHIDKALDMLDIKPGMTVGEVGGGFGYLVFKLADRVGPSGKVYNEDIWEEALELFQKRMEEKGYDNIEIVLGEPEDCKLPKYSLDYVFIHTVLIGIKEPANLFATIAPSLKPGGKLIIIEQEDGRAVSTSGDPIEKGYYRTKQEYLDCFSETVFQVDRVDDTLLPHDLIFILSVKDQN